MNDMAHWSPDIRSAPAMRRGSAGARHLALSELSAILSTLVTGLVFTVGFAIALMFAATLAIVVVLAVGLFGLAALAWRVRPRPAALRVAHAGHAWVAYRWDDSRR